MTKTLLVAPKIYVNDDRRKTFYESLKRVKTARYVWHVRNFNLLAEISIAESGIVKGMYDMVFANNFLTKFSNMYPFCIDRMWDFDDVPLDERDTYFQIYSYWRIDTKAFKADWFIDPNMIYDCECTPSGMPRNYICTNNDIPTHALKNFVFVRERFNNRKPLIQSVSGASSYFSLTNDFDTLKPNDVINAYMKRHKDIDLNRLAMSA